MPENDRTAAEDASTADIDPTVLRDERPSGQLTSGQRIGRYIIREILGEGGFAVVYLAEQTEPVRRLVALKVIKLGMDTKQVIARFEAERQALAMMDHPCVAKVFDAGVTDDGRSYFVMEHVPGVPITDHCDRQRLNIKQRLQLFMSVCDAVQHAHQKGIIHRDIKPGNVLVAVKEGSAVPKVIDFGVAKALHQKLTEKTLFTEQGQLIGTPEYMSPEQAEMTAQDIDTRSDIYSLGVLLYELLTGALPFDPKSLRKAAFAEIQRIIREEEPPKPSTRLSTLSDDTSLIASKRRADPKALLRELRGDLDWITMKALEKDRTRRYAAASEFAADISRHLEDEPVLAGPPTWMYRARKFVRRHKVGVSASAAVAMAVIAGTAGTTWQFVNATRAKQMISMQNFAWLTMDQGEHSFLPVTSLFAEEVERCRRELGDYHPATLMTMHTLAGMHAEEDRHEEAEALYVEVLQSRRRVLGEKHPDTLMTMSNLGALYEELDNKNEEAQKLYEQMLAVYSSTLGELHPNTIATMYRLGMVNEDLGNDGEAVGWYHRVWEAMDQVVDKDDPVRDRPHSIFLQEELAQALIRRGRFMAAQQVLKDALPRSRRALGDDDHRTLNLLYWQARVFLAQERYEEAERAVIESYQGRLEEPRSDTYVERCLLLGAQLYDAWGKPEKAAEWRAKLPHEVNSNEQDD